MLTPSSSSPTRAGWIRSMLAALAIVVVAASASRLGSAFIGARFPDRPMPRDLLFELLPYVAWPQYLTDLALVAGFALLVVYAARGHVREVPAMIALFGVMELTRALMIVLTPLAGPLGNGAHYGFIHMTQNGEFPSGHTATAMLFYLFVSEKDAPRTRWALLALVVVECVALLVSHGHYSIDIVGGLLLSYALWRVWVSGTALNWLKRWVTP